MGTAKTGMPKLGRELAKAAEAKGFLYSDEPVQADGLTSAFRYFEAIADYEEADRVLLKTTRARPEDLRFFETVWSIDSSRYRQIDSGTGSREPYNSPPTFRQELAKVASANADRLMKAEEKDAQGLTGNIAELSKAAAQSLQKLKNASLWMKFLPGEDSLLKIERNSEAMPS